MPSSDSEDFESADEGHSNVDKKERKKRLSSSNYSDSALESDQGLQKTPTKVTSSQKLATKVNKSLRVVTKKNTILVDFWP